MLLPRVFIWTLSLGLMVLGAGGVSGQAYPNKTIRIVTGAVGSSSDFQARFIAQGLTSSLTQPVTVENHANILIVEIVAKAPADGYSLLIEGSSLWIAPLLRKTPYDPVGDFSPISTVARSINVLVVHPSLPVNSVKELIALAKANPGVHNYASGGTGGSGHLTGELFKSMAGINLIHVPYKGGSAAVTDLIAGQVQITFDNPSTVMPLVKAGKLRALAVTSAQPSALVPGLPTVAASLPGFEATTLAGIYAPAKTPEAIIKRLNQEIVRVLNTADAKEKFFSRGIEISYSSPEELAATIKSDMARLSKVIKDAGIRVE